MKHKLSFIITLWWVLLMGFLGGMILWLAPKEERISEDENRYLAGMPKFSIESVLNGCYMCEVENFLSDGFFYRKDMIKLSSDIMGVLDISAPDETAVDMEQAVNEFMQEAAEENADTQISDNPSQTEQVTETAEEQEQTIDSGQYTFWLEYTDGNSRVIYDYPTENLDIAIDALNAYRGALPEDGQLHFFQIPYAYLGNLLIEDKTNKYAGWGCNAEDYMESKAIEGVYIHNGPEILEPYLMNHEPLYYTTDYHWSALGAYYALDGMRDEMGLSTIDYDDYEYTVYESYVGHGQYDDPENANGTDRLELMHTMFPVINSCKIDHLDEEEEIPYMYYNHSTYLAYLAGTIGPWRRIETGANTGRNCIVVTDSFGNAFTPYLFPYYDEVLILDLRPQYYSVIEAEYSVRKYIEYYEVDDAYFMLSTSSSMNAQYMLEYLPRFLDLSYETH